MKTPRARDPVVSAHEEDPLLRKRRADRGSRLAWLILFLALAATLLGWFDTKQEIEAAANERFQDCTHELVTLLQQSLSTREAMLRSSQALFLASEMVSASEWKSYASSLELARHFPDILALGYAPEVTQQDLPSLPGLASDAGVAGFRVHPESMAPRHEPIFYVFPSSGGDRSLIGFDLATAPALARTLGAAHAQGRPVLSPPLQVPLQSESLPESFLILPVFTDVPAADGHVDPSSRNVMGYVFMRLRLEKMIEGAMANRLQEFEIQVFDSGGSDEVPIYDSRTSYQPPPGHVPYLSSFLTLNAAGRPWAIRFATLPRFEQGLRLYGERYILVAGTAISLLLFAITWSLAHTRTRALAIARRMTRALREERTRLAEIAATLGEGLYVQDSHGIITYSNAAAEHLLGWGTDMLIGRKSLEVFTETPNENAVGTHRHAIERSAMHLDPYAPEETRFRCRDGSMLPVSVVSTPILRNDTVAGSVVAFQDLRERKRAEAALRESQQFEVLFQYSTDALFLMNLEGIIIDVNKGALETLRYTREELVGFPSARISRWSTLPPPGETIREFFDTLTQSQPLRGEAEFVRKDGTTFVVEIAFSPIVHEKRKMILFAAHDITDRKESERRVQRALDDLERSRREVEDINRRLAESNRELQRLSRRDGLTGIANRRYFDEYLQLEWQRATRDGRPLSLLLADVDHFKPYNDLYGHQAGDECLRRVAATLDRQLSRSIDMVARYGGEEFVIVLPETPLSGAVKLGDRMRTAVEELAILHQKSHVADHVTISIGVATMVPKPDQPPEGLVSAADGALYSAKQNGRNRVNAVRTDS